MKGHWLMRGLKMLAFAAVAIAVLGAVVMSLWNWLAPALFGGHTIGFLQALGLFVLGRLLFGGLGGRGGHHMHWRRRMTERWDSMSEDERARVRGAMRHGWGHRHGGRTAPEAPAEGNA